MASLAAALGRFTRIRFSSRRSMALSRSQGRFEAASRKTMSFSRARPSIWISSSVFIRRLPSCSPPPSPPRALMMESSSSMKIVEGWWCRARSKRTRISFSESPRHFETTVEAEMLKKVVSHSVATALARSVFPVPGGPKRRTPFQGASRPVKNCGYFRGITTASFISCFAFPRPTMLSQEIPGFRVRMSRWMVLASSRYSLSTLAPGAAFRSRLL
mmetsp:Transcript_70500/g.206770  ORF Transcript_70500/g.206770 Transcript_70500/m.206770 type:complete len:216 (-) Transcript_70500:483-1130(-)